MDGFYESRTGTWKGSGRRLWGADGPGGRGGMFEGSEGPERAAEGRHEGRQTRQVLSALFAFFCRILHRGADMASNASADRRCRWAATRSFLDTSSWTYRTANGTKRAVPRSMRGPGRRPHRTPRRGVAGAQGARHGSARGPAPPPAGDERNLYGSAGPGGDAVSLPSGVPAPGSRRDRPMKQVRRQLERQATDADLLQGAQPDGNRRAPAEAQMLDPSSARRRYFRGLLDRWLIGCGNRWHRCQGRRPGHG